MKSLAPRPPIPSGIVSRSYFLVLTSISLSCSTNTGKSMSRSRYASTGSSPQSHVYFVLFHHPLSCALNSDNS